jgi:hypothetical protein
MKMLNDCYSESVIVNYHRTSPVASLVVEESRKSSVLGRFIGFPLAYGMPFDPCHGDIPKDPVGILSTL